MTQTQRPELPPTGWTVTGHRDHGAITQPCARCRRLIRHAVIMRHPAHPATIEAGARCAVWLSGASRPASPNCDRYLVCNTGGRDYAHQHQDPHHPQRHPRRPWQLRRRHQPDRMGHHWAQGSPRPDPTLRPMWADGPVRGGGQPSWASPACAGQRALQHLHDRQDAPTGDAARRTAARRPRLASD